MKVIGVGFGRTGTWSLKHALDEIGAGPCFHMLDLIRNPDKVAPWHDAAIKGEVDFDAMFDGFESTIDWPGCSFWRELIEAYPEAKVLLNVRDFDGWYKSFNNTIYAVRKAAMAGELQQDASRPAPSPQLWEVIGHLIYERDLQGKVDQPDALRDLYYERIETIKAEVPAERLTVFELGKDGWETLAGMLGVEAPDTEFPHLHDTDEFRSEFGLPALA